MFLYLLCHAVISTGDKRQSLYEVFTNSLGNLQTKYFETGQYLVGIFTRLDVIPLPTPYIYNTGGTYAGQNWHNFSSTGIQANLAEHSNDCCGRSVLHIFQQHVFLTFTYTQGRNIRNLQQSRCQHILRIAPTFTFTELAMLFTHRCYRISCKTWLGVRLHSATSYYLCFDHFLLLFLLSCCWYI